MAAGITIKHKRKAGAFTNGELAAGELGLDTAGGGWYHSTDGATTAQLPVIVPSVSALPAPGTFGRIVALSGTAKPLFDNGTNWQYFDGSVYAAPGYLLESTTSLIACDLKKLRSAYSGYCLRVRSVSTSVETDIGFSGDLNFDWAAAAAAGSDLRVVTWYDQSGNGNHLTQSSASKQPALDQSNKEIYFDGSDDVFESPTLALSTLPALSVFTRIKANSLGGVQILFELGAGLAAGGFTVHSMGGAYDTYIESAGGAQTNKRLAVPDTTTHHAHSIIMNRALAAAAAIAVRLDGSSTGAAQDSAGTPSGNFANNKLYVGARGGTAYYAAVSLKSLVLLPSAANDATRDAVEAGTGVQND